MGDDLFGKRPDFPDVGETVDKLQKRCDAYERALKAIAGEWSSTDYLQLNGIYTPGLPLADACMRIAQHVLEREALAAGEGNDG